MLYPRLILSILNILASISRNVLYTSCPEFYTISVVRSIKLEERKFIKQSPSPAIQKCGTRESGRPGRVLAAIVRKVQFSLEYRKKQKGSRKINCIKEERRGCGVSYVTSYYIHDQKTGIFFNRPKWHKKRRILKLEEVQSVPHHSNPELSQVQVQANRIHHCVALKT